MQLVSSVYIKTLFANALGCSIDAELDTALTISDGACSFTLRLHDFDLASVLETSPKFTLTADDVCIFILCADDDTKLFVHVGFSIICLCIKRYIVMSIIHQRYDR